MTRLPKANPGNAYASHVFPAAHLTVVAGVNTGDPLTGIEDVCLGDVYELDNQGRAVRLFVEQSSGASSEPETRVAEGSEAGQPGQTLAVDGKLTFMTPDASKAELLLISLPGASGGRQRFILPLSPLEPSLDYTLIEVSPDPGPFTLSEISSIAFMRGTQITLANGVQCPIEDLKIGDLVLTRDNGPQPVRHIFSRTVRAVGAFAPVVVPKGTLGNASDLILSQHQRLFVYQRGPNRITDRAEMLVRAGDLVEGDVVAVRRGGFCDYVSLVFDRHEVIYAECIPAESLLVNEMTKRQLPTDELAELEACLPGLSQDPVLAAEAPSEALAAARSWLLKPTRRH